MRGFHKKLEALWRLLWLWGNSHAWRKPRISREDDRVEHRLAQ